MDGCYLLGEVVILVMGHAGGDVVNDFSSGVGIVRCGLACTTIPLQTSHEATVSSEIHLRDMHMVSYFPSKMRQKRDYN